MIVICTWQQFEVIKAQTDLKVEQYYGDKGVDEWDLTCWNREVEEHDVSANLLTLLYI